MSIANQYKLIANVDTLYTGILYLATGITMVTQYMSVANRYICTAMCHLETVVKTEPQAKDTTIPIQVTLERLHTVSCLNYAHTVKHDLFKT